jgi:hypothetical protein
MRHNGLPGSDFVAVADLEPQLADALLELLRDAGVPAYADAAAPQRGVYNEVRLPDRPTDRLFVDRERRDVARAVLEERLPGLLAEFEAALDAVAPDVHVESATDLPVIDEDVWASLVASFNAPAYDAEGHAITERPSDAVPPTLHQLAAPGPRDSELAPEDDHYEPPVPPPLGHVDPVNALAWLGVLGAPIFFAMALWTGIDVEGWWGLAGVGGFIGGFGVLVSRLGPDREDDGDDGAVL